MPILDNAKKALRSSKRKTLQNDLVRSRLSSGLKKLVKQPTAQNLNLVFSYIDKALKRNLLHRNKASRLKSRSSGLVKRV